MYAQYIGPIYAVLKILELVGHFGDRNFHKVIDGISNFFVTNKS